MSDSKLVQFSAVRKEKQEHLKREYERVLFNRILGSYTVIEKLGLKAVEVRDISKSGCNFRMVADQGHFQSGEEMELRFYFSQSTYVPTRVTIKRVGEAFEGGVKYFDYGCVFDTALSTHHAVESFVDFVQAYSENAKTDKGDTRLWF